MRINDGQGYGRHDEGDECFVGAEVCEMKASVLHPRHPEKICWGCDRYCSVDDMACGNGKERSPHPSELFGDDWDTWALLPPSMATDRKDP